MRYFKYLKLNKSKKIRYLHLKKKSRVYIVFLHGFMSDLEGQKPKTFLTFAKKINLVSWLLNTQAMGNPLANSLMAISQNGQLRPDF